MKVTLMLASCELVHSAAMSSLMKRLIQRTAPQIPPAATVPDERADIAHLLRRTSFGPFPSQVESVVATGYEQVLNGILNAPIPTVEKPNLAGDDQHGMLRNWWMDRLISVTAKDSNGGLHERMVWLWHGHFTSGFDKVNEVDLMWNQHALIRQHALGNFREFAKAITKDAAMLRYLDGDGSSGEAPNENYSREVMELFTLGQAHYSEADVRAGARALSGWYVDQTGAGRFDVGNAYDMPVTFLGRNNVRTADDVIDAICDHEACAPFIVGKLHAYFVGTAPSGARRGELAKIFRDNNLEIRPVVTAIVQHESFRASRYNRARLPSEWITAVTAALALTGDVVNDLRNAGGDLGQVLFEPPNVAGWPGTIKWVNPGNAITKGARVANLCFRDEAIRPSATVDGTLAHCGIYDASAATLAAMNEAASRCADDKERASVLLALALTSPEFCLA